MPHPPPPPSSPHSPPDWTPLPAVPEIGCWLPLGEYITGQSCLISPPPPYPHTPLDWTPQPAVPEIGCWLPLGEYITGQSCLISPPPPSPHTPLDWTPQPAVPEIGCWLPLGEYITGQSCLISPPPPYPHTSLDWTPQPAVPEIGCWLPLGEYITGQSCLTLPPPPTHLLTGLLNLLSLRQAAGYPWVSTSLASLASPSPLSPHTPTYWTPQPAVPETGCWLPLGEYITGQSCLTLPPTHLLTGLLNLLSLRQAAGCPWVSTSLASLASYPPLPLKPVVVNTTWLNL